MEVDIQRIGAETLIQKGATSLPNKMKPVLTSAIFKVQERKMSESSENLVDIKGVTQTTECDSIIPITSYFPQK